MAAEEVAGIGIGLLMLILVVTLAFGPWVFSMIATFIHQPKEKKMLLQREIQSSAKGDVLTTLSKPLGNGEIRQTKMLMASVVMSPSWVQMWIGSILTIFGGEINVFTEIVDWARREAKQRLREQVAEAGYDEVINLRIETSMLTKTSGGKDRTSGIEILAYGTAIKY